MKRIIYTTIEGGVCVVVPAPKEAIEKVLGPLTQAEYEAHVLERSIPVDAINVRSIEDIDIPANREFRNAWCDVTPETTIDIDLGRAKDLKLKELRVIRDVALDKLDKEFMKALDIGDAVELEKVRVKKQILRDFTNDLKALPAVGVNDTQVLDEIRYFGTLVV